MMQIIIDNWRKAAMEELSAISLVMADNYVVSIFTKIYLIHIYEAFLMQNRDSLKEL